MTMLFAGLSGLPQFDETYLIIGGIALVLLIVLKTVKKAVRTVLAVVAACALVIYFAAKLGIDLPLPFLKK
jgi:hypothetical protein